MKQQISPVAAVIAVLVVAGLAAVAYWQFGGSRYTGEKPPPTMPPSVAQEWNKYTKGAGTAPGTSGTPGGSSIPAGGPTGK